MGLDQVELGEACLGRGDGLVGIRVQVGRSVNSCARKTWLLLSRERPGIRESSHALRS